MVVGNVFSAIQRAQASVLHKPWQQQHSRSGASPTNPPHLIAATLASLTSTLTLPTLKSDFSGSICPLRGSSSTTLSPRVYENYDAEQELVLISERRRLQVCRVETDSSRPKLDLNVGCIDTFVEDRQGNPVIGLVKFVSALGTGEHLLVECDPIRLD